MGQLNIKLMTQEPLVWGLWFKVKNFNNMMWTRQVTNELFDVKHFRMNPSFIFCLVYLPIQMIRSQQLNVEERPFEEQSDESEDELGSIDYNENFNRDRIDMDEEEELRRRWIGFYYISGLLDF